MFARFTKMFVARRAAYVWTPALSAPTGSGLSTLLAFA